MRNLSFQLRQMLYSLFLGIVSTGLVLSASSEKNESVSCERRSSLMSRFNFLRKSSKKESTLREQIQNLEHKKQTKEKELNSTIQGQEEKTTEQENKPLVDDQSLLKEQIQAVKQENQALVQSYNSAKMGLDTVSICFIIASAIASKKTKKHKNK